MNKADLIEKVAGQANISKSAAETRLMHCWIASQTLCKEVIQLRLSVSERLQSAIVQRVWGVTRALVNLYISPHLIQPGLRREKP